MRIKVEVGTLCTTDYNRSGVRVIYIDLLPSITLRYVDWGRGREFNIYFSWLAWLLTVTMTSNKHK